MYQAVWTDGESGQEPPAAAILVAAAAMLLAVLYAPSRVWFVEVEGNEDGPRQEDSPGS